MYAQYFRTHSIWWLRASAKANGQFWSHQSIQGQLRTCTAACLQADAQRKPSWQRRQWHGDAMCRNLLQENWCQLSDYMFVLFLNHKLPDCTHSYSLGNEQAAELTSLRDSLLREPLRFQVFRHSAKTYFCVFFEQEAFGEQYTDIVGTAVDEVTGAEMLWRVCF